MSPQSQSTAKPDSSGENTFTGPLYPQLAVNPGPSNVSLSQFPQRVFVPLGLSSANMTFGEISGSVPTSDFEAQKKYLENQREVLQRQLQLLQTTKAEEVTDGCPTTSSDIKGESIPSASASGCDGHGETQETQS